MNSLALGFVLGVIATLVFVLVMMWVASKPEKTDD